MLLRPGNFKVQALRKDWSKYDGSWLVYEHPSFGVMGLYHGIIWYDREFNRRHRKRDFIWHHRWDNIEFDYGKDTVKYKMGATGPDQPPVRVKWKTVVAIGMVATGILFDLPVLFGLLYIFWALMDIQTGHAYIIEDISRYEHPVLALMA